MIDAKCGEDVVNLKHLSSCAQIEHVLKGHAEPVTQLSWSNDGRFLASASLDQSIRIWDAHNGDLVKTLSRHFSGVHAVAWAPNAAVLASASADKTVRLWEKRGDWPQTLDEHTEGVSTVCWSPDGDRLASAGDDCSIRVWNPRTRKFTLQRTEAEVSQLAWNPDGSILGAALLNGNVELWERGMGKRLDVLPVSENGACLCLGWTTDGSYVVSGTSNHTIVVWDFRRRRKGFVLEGHIAPVTAVGMSPDGRVIVSRSTTGEIRFWRCDTWEFVSHIKTIGSRESTGRVAFSLTQADCHLAVASGQYAVILRVDLSALISLGSGPDIPKYTNAKVVLLGDSGVGKSGLGLVLDGRDFAPTDSTHGRQVYTLYSDEVRTKDGRAEQREILLWDLAGQPGYRLIHQLHLDEVCVALVLFDSRSELDPFFGVRHWDRALRQAEQLRSEAGRLRKILVAARCDRGTVAVSHARILAFGKQLGFDSYLETSAKEGWGIKELSEAILSSIDWDLLPKVTSTRVFQHIKSFLFLEKEAGSVLSTADDLYRAFVNSAKTTIGEHLRAEFNTCVGLVESRGLIRRLSFGDLVLVKPELLDSYASSLINAAKSEPDGLGQLAEQDALVDCLLDIASIS